ncbi:hypothetical protein SAMN04489710_10793 [Paracidovorax konjaci]|uniref:Uncharacterized protein n=1 Tax=Paracidovorax konjaci TaxID=32040 RepID=A0A1I1VQV5_9BURK|nr:hypothetical protein SAMN04489710_10793 [Paracidovorax konjaci]
MKKPGACTGLFLGTSRASQEARGRCLRACRPWETAMQPAGSAWFAQQGQVRGQQRRPLWQQPSWGLPWPSSRRGRLSLQGLQQPSWSWLPSSPPVQRWTSSPTPPSWQAQQPSSRGPRPSLPVQQPSWRSWPSSQVRQPSSLEPPSLPVLQPSSLRQSSWRVQRPSWQEPQPSSLARPSWRPLPSSQVPRPSWRVQRPSLPEPQPSWPVQRPSWLPWPSWLEPLFSRRGLPSWRWSFSQLPSFSPWVDLQRALRACIGQEAIHGGGRVAAPTAMNTGTPRAAGFLRTAGAGRGMKIHGLEYRGANPRTMRRRTGTR